MKDLNEKIAYLRGLSDGLELGDSTKEGKILSGIISVVEDLAAAVLENGEQISDLDDYIAVIDEDLSDIEEVIYDSDEDEDEDYDEYDEDDEEFEYIELECPNCDEDISIDSDFITDGKAFCPNCDDEIEL